MHCTNIDICRVVLYKTMTCQFKGAGVVFLLLLSPAPIHYDLLISRFLLQQPLSVQSILGVLTAVVDILAVNRIYGAVALNALLYRSCCVWGDVKHYQSKHCMDSLSS